MSNPSGCTWTSHWYNMLIQYMQCTLRLHRACLAVILGNISTLFKTWKQFFSSKFVSVIRVEALHSITTKQIYSLLRDHSHAKISIIQITIQEGHPVSSWWPANNLNVTFERYPTSRMPKPRLCTGISSKSSEI